MERARLYLRILLSSFAKAEACVDFVEEKSGYPLGSGGFLGQTEDYPLRKSVVDHDQ